jgi:Flp pilus assembly pilin Flp
MYSKIQVIAAVVAAVGTVLFLWLTKQFHEMDAGYLPYFSLLAAFISVSMLKGVLLSPMEEEEEIHE